MVRSCLSMRCGASKARCPLDEGSRNRSDGPVSASSYFLGDPPPDPRFLASLGALSVAQSPQDEGKRRCMHGRSFFEMDDPSYQLSLLRETGPTDLLACHRTSWGILPQTPVFSLRSARCHWHNPPNMKANEGACMEKASLRWTILRISFLC